MVPKLLPPELLFGTVLFVPVKCAIPNVFSSCRMLHNFLLPIVVKWKEEAKKMDAFREEILNRIEAVNTALGQRIEAVNTALGQRIEAVNTALEQRITALGQRITEDNTALGQRITEDNTALGQRIEAVNERIGNVESLVNSHLLQNELDEINGKVRRSELQLASFDDLPSSLERLRGLKDYLIVLKNMMQDNVELKLNQVLRQHVTRFGMTFHPKVDHMEDQVGQITVRWNNVFLQVAERLCIVEGALQTQSVYRSQYNAEMDWINRVEAFIKSSQSPEELRPGGITHESRDDKMESEFKNLQKHILINEKINTEGEKFITDAKLYDLRLSQYYNSVISIHGAVAIQKLYRMVPQPKTGATIFTEELQLLNERFTELSFDVLDHKTSLLRTGVVSGLRICLLRSPIEEDNKVLTKQSRECNETIDEIKTLLAISVELVSLWTQIGAVATKKTASTCLAELAKKCATKCKEVQDFGKELKNYEDELAHRRKIISDKEQQLQLPRSSAGHSENRGPDTGTGSPPAKFSRLG